MKVRGGDYDGKKDLRTISFLSICISNYYILDILQVKLDRANCLLLSLFTQIKGVPADYAIEYFRRTMALHMATNGEYYRVSDIKYSLTYHTSL